MGNKSDVEKQVGYVVHLRHNDDYDCDDDRCRSRAVVRVTEKSGLAVSFGYYCKSCQPDTVLPAMAS